MSTPENNGSAPQGIEPLGQTAFNVERQMRLFAERTQKLTEFAYRELGAYMLFERVAAATVDALGSATVDITTRDGIAYAEDVFFPFIDYEPEPEDSSTRRLIELRRTTYYWDSAAQSVVPWLHVFKPDVVETQDNPDYGDATHSFVRMPLSIMCGFADGQGDAILDPLMDGLSERDNGHLDCLIQEQGEYIQWLSHAAATLGVEPVIYTQFRPPIDSAKNS